LAKALERSRVPRDLSPVVAADLAPLLRRSVDVLQAKGAPPITVQPRFSGPEWGCVLGAIEFAVNQFKPGHEARDFLLSARAEMMLAHGRVKS
jgi:hypothetical protein